ncbi:hypothetical protein DINM_002576 [Dirofilaria immitis]|nr:hypothetical protein [Dirofilaria immitis]
MRLSAFKLCKKITQATSKVNGKNFFEYMVRLEFALPTPDMVYDFHMKFSREFAGFAMGNKYGAGAFHHHKECERLKFSLRPGHSDTYKGNLFREVAGPTR